ncbi:hypothetical protein [Lactiplantibacillus songbeiensis]|uniref:Uncharacterized protein n=1 Tax=Lactiplantibacillus songbeiensis TaxID=2559920 RepID=A0ABW4C225_9LACO|nr:hypothetical protein [Lactiplantibacillus songbeiensis]
MLLLNLLLVYLVLRNVVIESQLELRSKYRWGQIVVAALLLIWSAYGGLTDFADLLFWSLFMMINIMMGTGGLAAKNLVLPGAWFRRTIAFDKITGIQIAAIPALNQKKRVIVKFVLDSRREINMIFTGTVTTVKEALQKRIGQKVAIEVSKFQ